MTYNMKFSYLSIVGILFSLILAAMLFEAVIELYKHEGS